MPTNFSFLDQLLANPDNDARVLLFDSFAVDRFLFVQMRDIRTIRAVNASATWGELRSNASDEIHDWLADRMGGPPVFASFEDFFEQVYKSREEQRSEALGAWADEPVCENRPPFPDDRLDIDGWNSNHPDGPITFISAMDDWVPSAIQESFGTIDDYSRQLILRDPILLRLVESSLPDRTRESVFIQDGQPRVLPDKTSPSPAPYAESVGENKSPPQIQTPLIQAFQAHGYSCLRSGLVRNLAGYGMWG